MTEQAVICVLWYQVLSLGVNAYLCHVFVLCVCGGGGGGGGMD